MSLLEVVPPVPATGFFTWAWLLIALPALSAAVLLLVGRAGDRWGHILGALVPLVTFAIGLSYFAQLLRCRGVRAGHFRAAVRLDLDRPLEHRSRPADRPAVHRLRTADHRRRRGDPRLLDRLHGSRREAPPVLRLHEPVRGGHAAAGAGRQLPSAVRRLGGSRPGLVPADRLLAAQAERGHGRQEGLRRQPGRRPRDVAGDHADAGHLRLIVVSRRQRGHALGERNARHHPRSAAVARRLRKVGAGAAAVLVARRHGGSDAGVGADPRRDHGDGRGLPGRPQSRRVRRVGGGQHRCGHRRHSHAAGRRLDRLRQGRHQEGSGRVDNVARSAT